MLEKGFVGFIFGGISGDYRGGYREGFWPIDHGGREERIQWGSDGKSMRAREEYGGDPKENPSEWERGDWKEDARDHNRLISLISVHIQFRL